MGETVAVHVVPGDDDLPPELAAEVGEVAERVTHEKWGAFDTFDWRLHRKGLRIYADETGRCKLREAGSGRLLGRLPKTPRFASDLPGDALGKRVARALSVRALLPVVEVRLERAVHGCRDRRGKVVARLHRVSAEARAAEGDGRVHERAEAWIELPQRIEIEALKGYGKAAERLRHAADRAELPTAETSLCTQALAVIGRQPGDYDSKIDVALTSKEPAAIAERRILWYLLTTLRANEAGTRDRLDSEFLHDFRVAVRRIRSALGQIKGALPAEETARLRQEFRWLQKLTGPARDLDVYLLHMPEYEASLPEPERGNLVPLRTFLEKRRQSAYRELTEGIDSERYARLIAAAEALIDDGTPGPKGDDRVGRLANRRIRKVYGRVLAEAGAIGPRSPAESLHELRKTCKKLRYLMEFFRRLYPRAEIAGRIRALKNLQENLGDFQDLCVQADALRTFSREMAADGTAQAETLLAMGRLIEGLDQRAVDTRAEFAERCAAFTRRKERRRFERLFGK